MFPAVIGYSIIYIHWVFNFWSACYINYWARSVEIFYYSPEVTDQWYASEKVAIKSI